jgi:nitrate/TMAO reductase-like tetraheme cytochrome c subunit
MKKFILNPYLIGLFISLAVITVLAWSDFHTLRTPGPANTGHENLACNECHESAEGSIRQQIQANVSYLFGQRTTVASFNFKFPDNKDCLACHEREDDRHTVYRFNEPRFIDVRKAIQPQFCVSCHKEHTGVRVSSDPENCRYCHQKLKIKDDPLDISHLDLIKLKNWNTCLACHDFHGNHIMKTPINTQDMLNQEQIKNYMSGGKDPYSDKKRTLQYRNTRYEN